MLHVFLLLCWTGHIPDAGKTGMKKKKTGGKYEKQTGNPSGFGRLNDP